jgi:hypothetical protein
MKMLLLTLIMSFATSCLAMSGDEELHSAVVTMHQLSLRLDAELDGLNDRSARSRKVRELARREVVEPASLRVCGALAIVSSEYLGLAGLNSDSEHLYECVFSAVIDRLVADGGEEARYELIGIRSRKVLDGRAAFLMHEALEKLR